MKKYCIVVLSLIVTLIASQFAHARPSYPDAVVIPRDVVKGATFDYYDWEKKQSINFDAFDRQGTPTKVVDPLPLSFSKLTALKPATPPGNFVVGYDPKNHVLVAFEPADTADFVTITRQMTPPPVKVTSIDAGSVKTMQGLRIGSTRLDVERVYGKATHVDSKHGITQLMYSRQPGADPNYTIMTAFLLQGKTVVGIERISGT